MFARKLLATCIFTCFVGCIANAQRNKHIIDSIETAVKKQTDTTLVKSWSELIWQYRLVNQQKAVDYGLKAITLGKKLNFQKGLAQAYNDLGIIYYDMENYDSSIQLYQAALDIRNKLHDDIGIARLYNKIGIVYQKQGDFSKALFNQQNALKLFEKTNDPIGISYSLNNIGILQQNLGRYDEAIDYHSQSIAIKQKLNDRAGLLQSYINIANIWKLQTELDQAESYYSKAVQLAEEMGNKEYISTGLNNLGDLYIRKKEYAKAASVIHRSFLLRESVNDKKGMASSLNNLGSLFIASEKFDSAAIVLDKAEQIARTGINTKPELIMIYQTQSKLYEAAGKTTNSLDYYKLYAALKDSLFSDDLSSKFTELEAKYNTLQKEKTIELQKAELNKKLYEIARQKLLLSENELMLAGSQLEIREKNEQILEQRLDSSQQAERITGLDKQNKINNLELSNQKLEVGRKNTMLAVTGVVSVMLLLLSYSYYRRYKLKQEKKLQEEVMHQQQMATKAVMVAEENERQRIASDLHDGVGQMMSAAKMNLSAIVREIPFANDNQRVVYHKVVSLVDESCKEVRTVSHNMMSNALTKGGLAMAIEEFINKIDDRVIRIDLHQEGLEKRLDSNTETVLYRIVQECVNNVLKHAEANHLDISIIKDQDGIAITIEDNGKGFALNEKSQGIGMKNIHSRVAYLKGSIDWDSSPGRGTLIAIAIPA